MKISEQLDKECPILVGAGDDGLSEKMVEITVTKDNITRGIIGNIAVAGDIANSTSCILVEDQFTSPPFLITRLPDIPDIIYTDDDIKRVPFTGPKHKKYKPSRNCNKKGKKGSKKR